MSRATKSRAIKWPKEPADTDPVLFEYTLSEGETKEVITFTKHDFAQLQSPNYLNDTIITFFMQFQMDSMIDVDFRSRVHVFSSFFLNKIRSIYKPEQRNRNSNRNNNNITEIISNTSTPNVSPIKSNNNCASRWLKGVDIFEKDFLFLPVCEDDHWLLVIICYPRHDPKHSTESIPDEDLTEPAVFVLNSTKDRAPAVKKALQKFLAHQWNLGGKSDRSFAINNAKSNGIRLFFPEVPQQKNNYNCGVYLLNYFKCFMNSPRESYIKMFRQRSLTNWFEINQIRVQNSRSRLIEMIKKQSAQWAAASESRGKRIATDSDSQLSEKSQRSSQVSNDIPVIEIN